MCGRYILCDVGGTFYSDVFGTFTPDADTVGSANNVEWQVGGTIGTGVTIGGGIVPGGVDLQAALEGHVATDLTNIIQQTDAWELPADPGTIREYTIMWRETWQPAYIDVTFMDPEPQIMRIDVKYRTGIQSDIVGDNVTRCDLGTEPQTESSVTPEVTQPTGEAPEASVNPPDADTYPGWVICWHGRDGYEYLIAYPEADFRQGISLHFPLVNAQGDSVELANDSLKMCLFNGEWYGRPDPTPWFPVVSFAQLGDGEILLCADSPGCNGDSWAILPLRYFPSSAPTLQSPTGNGVHVVAYSDSR